MRERVEDLGRILEICNYLLDDPVFKAKWESNEKMTISEEQKEFVRGVMRSVCRLEDNLKTMLEIASGEDDVNQMNRCQPT